MAEMIPVDASLPPCPMDVTPLSSLESDNFVFVENTHPNKILDGLNNLRLKNEFCDVILCCEGQEFSCHRNVLASFSPYFEAMFTTEWMESQQIRVAINGVEPQIIGMMVNYAYTSKVLISTANVQALLAASNLLNVMAVQEACCHYMERHMDEKNCVGIHCFAEIHSCKKLEKHSRHYILEHFSVVYQQEEFLSLSVDKMTEILSNDDLNVSKEEMVFEAAMLWLNKCPTRQSFEKVLEHIRLPFISPSYLHDVIESLDVVKESQGCQRLISEAKNQHLLPYSHRAEPRRAKVILMLGGEERYRPLASVESFNRWTNQWKTLACLPFAVSNHSVVVSGSTLYLAVFSEESTSREMWRYDPSHDDSWLKMAPMIYAHENPFSLVMLDGHVYAVGDHRIVNVERPHTRVQRYTPNTNTWKLVATPDSMISYYFGIGPVVVALDGLLYFIGVDVIREGGVELFEPQVFNFNPNTNAWTEVASMQNIARARFVACTLKGKIYIMGGIDDDVEPMDRVECYDPETNQWTMCAPMKMPRSSPGVAVVDGMIYVLGGQRDEDRFVWSQARSQHTIERYCEDTDLWEVVGEMPTFRTYFGCVSLWLWKDALCELRGR